MSLTFLCIQPLYDFWLEHLGHLHLMLFSIDIYLFTLKTFFSSYFFVLFCSTFALFPCDSMTIFSAVFGFFLFEYVCLL